LVEQLLLSNPTMRKRHLESILTQMMMLPQGSNPNRTLMMIASSLLPHRQYRHVQSNQGESFESGDPKNFASQG
jgi:hypothetical protein